MRLESNITIEVNSNFHHLAGEDLFKENDDKFKEYRKRWKEWPQNFYVGDFPLFIDIEATDACNLKCPFCVTTIKGESVKKGLISFEIVKKIIDEGADYGLYGVKFNIRGEPLLHPQIYEFVGYAKKKGLIDVYFNTNAVLLTKETSKRLIESGLDRISISFEGYSKAVYERYRVGAIYEKVLSNIENLQTLKRKLGVQHPKVRVQTIMLADLKISFQNYKKFWNKHVEEVAFLDYKKMKEKKKGIYYPWACPQIYQRMGVFWDGTILPCNHDDDALLALGNIRDMQIREAWNCGELNKIRDMHKRGCAHEIPACNGCYLRDSEILKLIKKEKRYDCRSFNR